MFTPFNKIIVRNPYYPFSILEKALKSEEEYKKVIIDPIFKEALFLASPDLYEELIKISHQEDIKEESRLKDSLIRYLTRMCSRCTPFGLFATCSTGNIGEQTNLQVSPHIHAITRPDMFYLCGLAQYLSQIPKIKYNLIYFINDTLYLSGKKYRYIEYQYVKNNREHALVQIKTNPLLKEILKVAQKGMEYTKLEQYIVDLTDGSLSETQQYINYLIDNQILVSEIEPFITGKDYFSHLITVLERIGFTGEIRTCLDAIHSHLLSLNKNEVNKERFESYQTIIQQLDQIGIEYNKQYIFQVDSYRKKNLFTLSKQLIANIQDSLFFLSKFTDISTNSRFEEFKSIFTKRYEGDSMPLLHVLDPELGIGYPANQNIRNDELIDDLVLPSVVTNKATEDIRNPYLYHLLAEKLVQRDKNSLQIILTDEDLKEIQENRQHYPPTLAISCRIAENKGKFVIKLNGGGGSTAASLIGRFGYLNKELEILTKDICNFEKSFYKEDLVAEIAHLSDSRIGNIASRPHLREYEINYLSLGFPDEVKKIDCNDLYLKLEKGKLVLYSKSLKKNIQPRLTNAHNYSLSKIPLYSFLCDFQHIETNTSFYFSWKGLGFHSFLPRVKYKEIILSLATWKVNISEIKHLFSLHDKKLMEEVEKWRKPLLIPQYIHFVEGDNKLLVDLMNPVSIQAFFRVIKKQSRIFIEESLVNEYDKNSDFHLNECLIFFKHMPYENNTKGVPARG